MSGDNTRCGLRAQLQVEGCKLKVSCFGCPLSTRVAYPVGAA